MILIEKRLKEGSGLRITGIGSRKTPDWALHDMKKFCELYSSRHTLRSGGADGADTVFEENWLGEKQIFLPWEGFNNRTSGIVISGSVKRHAQEIAKTVIDNRHWSNLSKGAKSLHTRNVCQVLGFSLKVPSNLVICYCEKKGNRYVGGTATAVKLARDNFIPVVNLAESGSPMTNWFYENILERRGMFGI